jgi:hypothetical protein
MFIVVTCDHFLFFLAEFMRSLDWYTSWTPPGPYFTLFFYYDLNLNFFHCFFIVGVPDPQGPYVFGLPDLGPDPDPCSRKGVERTEIMPENKILRQNLAKD